MAKTIPAQPTNAPLQTREGFAVGRAPTTADTVGKLPSFGSRGRAFRLSHHPTSWELFETAEGWRLLPVLSRLSLAPGVNWTKNTRDVSDLEAKARSRWNQTVLTDWGDYVRLYPGANDTTGFFLLWEQVRIYDDGAFEVETDTEAYALWRWSLVTSRTLAPPRRSVVSEIRNRLKKAQRRATRTPHLMQAQQAQANAEKRLAGLEEALAALEALRRGEPMPPAAPLDEDPVDELREEAERVARLRKQLEAEVEELRQLQAKRAELLADLETPEVEAPADDPHPKTPARKGSRRKAKETPDG